MEEEKDKISQLLENLKKSKARSNVPENYFRDFDKSLFERINKEQPFNNKTLRLKVSPTYIFTAAAAVLLIIMTWLWYMQGDLRSNPFDYRIIMSTNIEDDLKKLQPGENDEFVIAAIDEIEREELVELIGENDITAFEYSSGFDVDSLKPLPQKTDPLVPEKKEKANRLNEFEDLDDELADETELDELFEDLDDEELVKLEKTILKPKTEIKPKPN